MTHPKIQKCPVYIYALIDPETNLLRYIGQSKNPNRRLKNHLCPSHLKITNHKNNWIKSLKSKGLKPQLLIIEKVQESEADEIEFHYISYFRFIGCKLTNLAAKGKTYRGPKTGLKAKGTPATGKNKKGMTREFQFIPVLRIDTLTGEVVRYKSVVDTQNDGFIPTAVTSVCKGRNLTHKGYAWKYESGKGKDTINSKKVFPRKKLRPVIGTNTKTGKQFIFSSAYEAQSVLKIDRRIIRNICDGKRKTIHGWTWRFA